MKILFSVYNISGYLMAELGELAKSAQVAILHTPYDTSDLAVKYPHYIWIDRTKVSTTADIESALGTFKPELFFCGGWFDKLLLSFARKLRLNGVRTVLLVDTPWQSNWRQVLHCCFSRFTLVPFFSWAWGAGEPQERYLRYLGFAKQNIRRGYYCADTNKFASIGAARLAASAAYSQSPASCVWPHTFLYVGRYVAVKNMRRMERAFLKALEAMPESDWSFTCIGEGVLWNERTLHPRIRHLGYKQPSEIQNYVKDAGCFVLPSVYEPWGVVVHEAALMGLPMLCSDRIQAATAYLREEVNGFTFDPLDEESMSASFLKIMRMNDAQLEDFGRESYRLGLTYTLPDWVACALSE